MQSIFRRIEDVMNRVKKAVCFAACAAFSAALIFTLTSCNKKAGDSGQKSDTGSADWRNTIAYEGSFRVNENTKLLYALDTGTVTLWDDAGEGDVLQTLRYDTTVNDALERFERRDVNGDGNADIRIVYSEGDGGSTYNLWLWNQSDGRYTECPAYRLIRDPDNDTEGHRVLESRDTGGLGILKNTYVFTENLGLELETSVLEGETQAAESVAQGLAGASSIREAEGSATVNDETCKVYVASGEGGDTAYIAISPTAQWYIDIGCVGAYRTVSCRDGSYSAGAYAGYAGEAEIIGQELSSGPVTVNAVHKGSFGDGKAVMLELSGENGWKCFLLREDQTGLWYYSENSRSFYPVYTESGGIGETPTEKGFEG